MRAPHIESDAVAELVLLQAAEVELLETFQLLKERTEVMRRHVLALRQEAVHVRAMRRPDIGSPTAPLRDVSRTAWKALPLIEGSQARCPKCESPLKPFPLATNALLVCADCGFVAKPVRARHS
ncbi:MAG: hypothetical protein ACJ796_08075 [Gemmatimonadaceae bacterium]